MRNFSYIYVVKDEIIRAGLTFNITRQINSLNYPACLIKNKGYEVFRKIK